MCIFAPKKKIMEEIWKDIEGYEGLYQVSNTGRVRSLKRNIILKNRIARGYERVVLRTNNIPKEYSVHRLVATAFIPNPDNLPQVNHIDEDKTNNCVNNLEWCDGKYNINYGTGIAKSARSRSKKVLQFKLDGTFVKEWKSIIDVERMTGYSGGHISECCRGKHAYAYGFLWKYKKEIE